MKKVRVQIYETSEGFYLVKIPNVSSEKKIGVDIRDVYDKYDKLDNNKIITLFSFDRDGCYLILMRFDGGRGQDNVSAWIDIPNSLDISGQDVVKMVDSTKEILKKATKYITKEDLQSIIGKEYNEKKCVRPIEAPSGDDYAVRYTTKDCSLEKLLGRDKYQSCYNKYKYIILIDEKDGISIRHDLKIDDLTDKPFEEYYEVYPPMADKLENVYGKSATLYYSIEKSQPKPFTQPILCKKGTNLKCVVKRTDFIDCTFPHIVNTDEEVVLPTKGSDVTIWEKKITLESFRVVDEDSGKDIEKDNITIKIKGTHLEWSGLTLSEDDCRKAKIEVRAGGYETKEQNNVNLLNPPHTVKLKKEMKEIKWKISFIEEDKTGDVNFNSRSVGKLSRKKSPLKGYIYNEDTEELEFDTKRDWWQRAIGFVSCLVLFVLLVFGYWFFYLHGNTPEPSKNSSPGLTTHNKQTEKPERTKEDAISYLDGKEQWNRTDMESYNELKGLYDALNTAYYNKVKNFSDKLDNKSEKLKTIVDVLKSSDKKGKHFPDGTISSDKYIKWLKERGAPKTEMQKSEGKNKKQNKSDNASSETF